MDMGGNGWVVVDRMVLMKKVDRGEGADVG